MSLHMELLNQAKHLATREPRRPKQASLRRAVSAAYYALFHLLTFEASGNFVKAADLSSRINRTFNHGDMKKVSKHFAGGVVPKAIKGQGTVSVPQLLKNVAQNFVDLQEARHEADYNLAKSFTRKEALGIVKVVEQCFVEWNHVRKNDISRIYLACFLLWDKWEKER